TSEDDEGDAGSDPNHLSLRQALAQANANPGADTITFAPSLAGVPLHLTRGPLRITDPVTIGAFGAPATVLDAQQHSRVFDITATAGNVTLRNLVLTGGRTTEDNEGGGAIRALTTGVLALRGVTMTGNATEGRQAHGGGLFASGASQVIVIGGAVTDNFTEGVQANGGGIYADVRTLSVIGGRVAGNSTRGNNGKGGGLYTVGG